MQTEIEQITDGGLTLFSVYTGGPASANERWAVSQIKLAVGSRRLRSDSWKLGTLLSGEPMWKMATRVATHADVIVIAIGSLNQRQEPLIRWLDATADAMTNHTAPRLIIGLLGAEDTRPAELDWHVKQLIRCARSMRAEFIWHWMGIDTVTDTDFMGESISNLIDAKRSFEPALIASGTLRAFR